MTAASVGRSSALVIASAAAGLSCASSDSFMARACGTGNVSPVRRAAALGVSLYRIKLSRGRPSIGPTDRELNRSRTGSAGVVSIVDALKKGLQAGAGAGQEARHRVVAVFGFCHVDPIVGDALRNF